MRVVTLLLLAVLPTVLGFGASRHTFDPVPLGHACRKDSDCAEGVCKSSHATLWAAISKMVCQFDVETFDTSIHLTVYDAEGNVVGEGEGQGAADDDIGNYMYDVNHLWEQGATVRWCLLASTVPASMDLASARAAIKRGADDWGQYINLKIEETTDCYDEWTVRVDASPGGGCASYVGPGALKSGQLGTTKPFMWLGQGCWTHGIILHEWGHLLGLQHEHQSPNFPYEIDYERVGISQQQFDTNYKKETMRATLKVSEYDPNSIMLYQLPARLMTNAPAGFTGTKHNEFLSDIDKRGAMEMYPGGGTPCLDDTGAVVPCPTGEANTGAGDSGYGHDEEPECPYENDGECDVPVFCRAGTDTADCPSSSGQPEATCAWEGDGECDVPAWCPAGTDTQDCWNAAPCPYEGDGECDVPDWCSPGTDLADCAGQPARFVPPTGCSYKNDGYCDEPDFCAPGTDEADCRGPKTPVQWCFSDGDGFCDETYGGCPPGTDSDCRTQG